MYFVEDGGIEIFVSDNDGIEKKVKVF